MRIRPLICVWMICVHFAAWGNPQNPTVVSGEATFGSGTNALDIMASDHAIIEWEAFSIGQGEKTNFMLPSSDSAVLNRVTSHLPSSLEGLLNSNGKVYLINPNGVLVTESGIINTSEFWASTLDINNVDFLAGLDLLFAGSSQEGIINRGMITAWNGDVVLISYKISNEGEINAPAGVAALGVGSEVLVTPKADQRITIHIPVVGDAYDSQGVGLSQEGIITALQAELKADGNPYALAIQNKGLVHAVTVEKSGGRIFLVAQEGVTSNTGVLEAIGTNNVGGEIQILGKTITMTDGAIVDVSGDCGGGHIFVGGGYQGSDSSIFNAQQTFIDDSVVMKADAMHSGNGGQVIVWADWHTTFFGNISACGGKISGDGGFVEVSSKNMLDYFGFADRRAPFGIAGTLLLDPSDLTISNGADSNISFVSPNYTGTAASGNINIPNLIVNLAGGNVTISTTSGFAGGGDIVFLNNVTWVAGANTLTLNAVRNIVMNSGVTFTNSIGSIAFNAGTTADGSIIMVGSSALTMSGTGTLAITANNTAAAGINLFGTITYSSSGAFTIDTSAIAGEINIGGGGIALATTAPLTITSAAGSDINITDSINNSMAGQITVNSGNNFYLQGELIAGDTLTVSAIQASLIGTSLNQTLMQTSSGDLNLTCETLLLDTNTVINLSAGTGTLNVTVNAPGNCLINNGSSIQSASTPIGNAAVLTFAGDLTIQGGGIGLSQIAVTGGSDLSITTTGDLFALNNALIENSTVGASTTITVAGSTYLTAGAGPVTILGGTGDLNVIVTGNVYLLSDDTGGSSIISAGNLTVTSTENMYIIGQPGANDSLISTSAGNLTVSADSGNLELTNAAHITLTGGVGSLSFTAGNDLIINNDSSIESASSMDATGIAGNALFIIGGTDGNASIVSAQGLTFTMAAVTGSIDIMTVSSGEAFISVGATSSIATGMTGTLTMNGLASSVNAYIETSLGDLTVTASRIGMNNFSHIEILAGAGLLTVDATAGDFSLANGSHLTNAGTGGISTTTTVGYLYIVGGPSSQGGSYIDGGSGTSSITAQGIQMSGYSSSLFPFNGARISSSGDLTVTATLADLTMNPFSYIELTGTGLLDIEVMTTDLLIDNGSSIVNLGSGTTTINVAAGTISLLGGAGDSLISATTGLLNVTAGSNVRMLAHEDGSTSMTATTGDITVSCGANLLMAGAPESMQTSSISTEGLITIGATNNVIVRDDSNITVPLAGAGNIGITTLNGDLSVENGSTITNAGSGTIIATVGVMGSGNVLIRGGSTGGNSSITAASDGITISIPNGNLNIEAVSGGSALITAADTTSITIGTSGKISVMGFSMAFPATVSSTVGDLTVTGGSLDMKDFSTISLAGTGALNVTSSMGDLRIENASEILNSGSGLTTVDASGFEMVLQSGTNGAALITGGSGGTTVNAASLLMTGFDATGSAITATGGDINVTSTADATLAYLSSIHLTGGLGTLNITTTGDLVILDGSSVQTDAAGPYVISVGGTSILASGASSVIVTSTVSVMASSYTVAGSLFVLSDGSGSATISADGPLTVSSTIESIHLIGSSFGGNPALITTSAGALTVTAAAHITLYDDAAITLTAGAGALTVTATDGDLIVDNGSNIQQQGTGALIANAGGNAVVKGGLAGNSSILNNFDMTVIVGGSLNIQAVSAGSAIISANGIATITVTDKILLSGFSAMSTASIFDLSGDLTVSGSSVELIDFSNINLADMIIGTLNVQSIVSDIIVYNNSFIQNTGAGGTTTSSGGSLFILGGPDGDATIFPGIGTYTLMITGDLNLVADIGGGAYIAANGPIMAMISDNILLNGFSGMNLARIATDTTFGDLTIIAGNKVNVQNHALITMDLASTGNLSVTTMTGDLTVENDAMIISPGSAGMLTIASTLGNVIVRAGAEGEALIQGLNDFTLTAGGAFEVEALSGMEAAVLSSGDTTIAVAGAFRVLGFSPLVRARVENEVGMMTIGVDGVTTIYPHASVLLSGGAGTFTMTLDDDMVLGDDSFIRSDAIGAMSINVTGSATIVAGAGNAIVSGTVTTLNFTTTKNIFVLADETGFSEITSGLALTVQSIDGSISVIGSLSGSNTAAIHNGLGTLDVTAATDISLQDHGSIYTSFGAGALTVTATASNINIINDSFIAHQGTGSVIVVTGADLLIKSGFDGSAFISGNDTVDVTLTGNLDIESGIGGAAYISGADTTNVIATTGRVRIAGNSFVNDAYIQTTDGDLTVTGVSFDILDFGSINLLGGVGTLTVNDLLGDFRVSNVSFIRNLGTGIANINAANSLFVTGGTDGAAGLIYTTGVFNLNVAGDINLQADIGGGAFISGDADLVVAGNSNIAIVGEPSGPSSYFTTTTGIINVTTLGQIVIRDNAFIDLTGGIGDVIVSTVAADLVIENNAFVRNQGTGNQVITSGANLTVRAGTSGDAFISGNGTLLLTAVGQLDVEAQLLSAASILSNGDTLITANTINMLGSTTLVPATIVNGMGNMTIFAGLTTLTAHSGITLLGGIGNFLMVISDDLLIANDSAVNILSTGMTGTILVSGSATLLAGAGNAAVFNNTDTFTMIAANNLSLISDLNGSATIITNGLTGAITAASVLVNGDSSGLNVAEILATGGDLSVTAVTNTTVSNNGSISISGGAGTLTTIAITGDLNVQNDSFLSHLGTGNVVVTVGANGLIKGGPLGDSTISGNADVSYTGTGSLTIESVATGAASILGSGTMMIVADTLEMLGDTTLIRASIINSPGAMTVGDLIITIVRHATVVPYSDVFLTNGLGVYTMTVGEDLVLSNDSFFTNTAAGAMTITVGGSAIIAAGVGNAIVQGVTSTTSFTAAKNIFVLSDSTGISEITSGSSLTVTSTGGSININGSISGANLASINNVSGPLTVTALTDITLQDFGSIFSLGGIDPLIVTATTGNFNMINNSFVNHLGTGSVTVTAGADALIKAGFQGPSFVVGTTTVDLTTGGNLDILADSGGPAFISGQTTSNVTATGRIRIAGDSIANTAFIQTLSGSLTVTGGSYDIIDFGSISLIGGVGTLTVNSASGDFRLSNASFVRNLGTGPTNVNLANSLFTTGGSDGAAGFIYTTGAFNLNVPGLISFQADLGGNAFISGANTLTIIGNDSVSLVGVPGGAAAFFTTSSGAITVSASGGITVRDNAFIDLSDLLGAGAITLVATNDIVIENASFVINQGTGSNIIVGGANVAVRGGASGDASIVNNGPLTLVTPGLLDMEGQVIGAASIISNGTTTFVVGQMNMRAFASLQPATILNQSGDLTIVTGLATLSANANITLSGGVGNYVLSCSDDLFVNDNSALNNLSTGIMNIFVTRSANFIAGAGNASLLNLGGTLIVSAGNFLNLIADPNGSANFTTTSTTAMISAANILLSGDPAAVTSAIILATQGTLSITATDNITARDNSVILLATGAGALTVTTTSGDLSLQNAATLVHAGTGNITMTIGANCNVIGGFTGPALIQGGANVILIATGDLNVEAASGNTATVFTNDLLLIVAGNVKTKGFDLATRATIASNIGDLIIVANNLNHLRHSTIGINSGMTGDLIITLSQDLMAFDDVEINNLSTGAITTILSGGNMTFSGGTLGAASILSNALVLSILATGDITFSGLQGGNAFLTTNSATAIVQSGGGNIYVTGDSAGIPTVLTALGGTFTIFANNNIHLYQNVDINLAAGAGALTAISTLGDINIENLASFRHVGTGAVNIISAANAAIFGGNVGLGLVSSNSTLTITAAGNLEMGSRSGGAVNVLSDGDTTYIAGGHFSISGYPGFPALASNASGNFNVIASDVTVENLASILLTGGIGTYTITAVTNDINALNNATLQSSSTGTMILAPNFNLNMIAGAGPVLVETTDPLSDLVISTSLMQGDLIMVGDVLSSSIIRINGGSFTASIAGRATLDTNALITNTVGSGAIIMTLNEDLLIDNATINHLGTGTITITTFGDFVLHENSTILGNNDLTLMGNNLLMDAPGVAMVQNVTILGLGTMTITMAERILLTSNALIANQMGSVGDMNITSSSVSLITGNSGILHRGLGNINYTSFDSLNLVGGPGDAFIQTLLGDITLDVTSNVTATSNDSALFATNVAQINANGNLVIEANNVLLGGQTTTAAIPTVTTQFTSNGDLTIVADVNITLRNGSIIRNANVLTGKIILVADNAFPSTMSGVGPGHIFIDRYSNIFNAFENAHIFWYTSAWGERGLPFNVNSGNGDTNFGNFNGSAWAFFFDPTDVPAATGGGFTNTFSTYYPTGVGNPTFENATAAFFYKVTAIQPPPPPPCPPCPPAPVPTPVPSSVIAADLANTAFASSELSFTLRMYEWDRFGYSFLTCGYSEGSTNAVLRKNNTMWPMEFNISEDCSSDASHWRGLEMQEFASSDEFLNGEYKLLSYKNYFLSCEEEEDAGQVNPILRKNEVITNEMYAKL